MKYFPKKGRQRSEESEQDCFEGQLKALKRVCLEREYALYVYRSWKKLWPENRCYQEVDLGCLKQNSLGRNF